MVLAVTALLLTTRIGGSSIEADLPASIRLDSIVDGPGSQETSELDPLEVIPDPERFGTDRAPQEGRAPTSTTGSAPAVTPETGSTAGLPTTWPGSPSPARSASSEDPSTDGSEHDGSGDHDDSGTGDENDDDLGQDDPDDSDDDPRDDDDDPDDSDGADETAQYHHLRDGR